MRIVIGADGSRASRRACELVAGRTWPIGTRVTVMGVVEPSLDWSGVTPPVADLIESEIESLPLVLEEHADALRAAGLAVDTLLARGPAADRLMAHASEAFADLIVVGSRGRGPAASAILGSVSAHLVDHAPCPVLVVRSPQISRMLLASDGTPSSRSVPSVLASWGNAFRGLPVEVLSVAPRTGFVTPWAIWGDEDDDADLVIHEEIADRVADQLMDLGFHAAATSQAGDAGRMIVAEGERWGADLIVTGSRGIGTLHRLMAGSVAHDVLMHARSSVLVVRGGVPAPLTSAVADLAPA